MKTLAEQYLKVATAYIKAFEKKQGFEFSYWITASDLQIACFIDQYFFNLDDIRHDIDNKAPKGLIFEWHDAQLEAYQSGDERTINYRSYVMGARFDHLNNNQP